MHTNVCFFGVCSARLHQSFEYNLGADDGDDDDDNENDKKRERREKEAGEKV